ncbi:MAG: hypothetical protein FJ027_21290 [Candidatus Rokubacteria bacterium]|nr:hypothetical protein [Candidatus Rokubacteria bacterium]
MTDRRILVILADVAEDAHILPKYRLFDVSDAVATALREANVDVEMIETRLVPALIDGASHFHTFAAAHVLRLPRLERFAALAQLVAVAAEARAEERRRLCSDSLAYELAVQLTRDEIERHAGRTA